MPHVSQRGTARGTVCPSPPPSPPVGQKLCSRCSRLGALRRIGSCAEGTAPRREGWGVKPRAATAPPAVPSQKVGCYSGTSQFSLSVLVPGNKGPVQAERQAPCSAKRLNFTCNTVGRTPRLWTLSKNNGDLCREQFETLVGPGHKGKRQGTRS